MPNNGEITSTCISLEINSIINFLKEKHNNTNNTLNSICDNIAYLLEYEKSKQKELNNQVALSGIISNLPQILENYKKSSTEETISDINVYLDGILPQIISQINDGRIK